MKDWKDTLRDFSAVIRSGADFTPGEITCPRYPEQRGVGVYRNNYRGNLHDTLAGAFPVIRQLVGETFFRLLAKRYIEQHPSRSGDLHRYGDGMATFLAHFEDTRHLAYLPDMAQLEWAYHRAYFADDVPSFDLARLAGIAPDSYAGLYWRLHPGCTLLATAFPVLAIWLAHQKAMPEQLDIDLGSGGQHLLVHRNGLDPEITHITPDSHHWLARLQQGQSLGEVTEATLARYPGFDLAGELRSWLAQGVLADCHTTKEDGT